MKKNVLFAPILPLWSRCQREAQFAKPEDPTQYRRSSMTVPLTHVYRTTNMVNGQKPFDPNVAPENTEIILAISKLSWPTFSSRTDKGETRASPAIWTQQAKFKDSAEN